MAGADNGSMSAKKQEQLGKTKISLLLIYLQPLQWFLEQKLEVTEYMKSQKIF
jgi:hypothetical protein